MGVFVSVASTWAEIHYGAYTFVTRLVEAPAAAIPGQVGTVLLAFGLASATGVALAGQVAAHTSRALAAFAAVTAVTAVAIALLMFVDRGVVIGMGIVAVWGLVSGAVPPLAQTEILRRGGPEHRSTAGAIIPVLFNSGIAVGVALAALVVGGGGVEALPVPAAAVVALAARSGLRSSGSGSGAASCASSLGMRPSPRSAATRRHDGGRRSGTGPFLCRTQRRVRRETDSRGGPRGALSTSDRTDAGRTTV